MVALAWWFAMVAVVCWCDGVGWWWTTEGGTLLVMVEAVVQSIVIRH